MKHFLFAIAFPVGVVLLALAYCMIRAIWFDVSAKQIEKHGFIGLIIISALATYGLFMIGWQVY